LAKQSFGHFLDSSFLLFALSRPKRRDATTISPETSG
jgi:hypothetical protein